MPLCPPCALNLLATRSRWCERNPTAVRALWPTFDAACNRRSCVAARKLAAAGQELTLFAPTPKETA